MRKCYGGIDLGGSFIKAGLLSLDGERLGRFRLPTGVELGISTVKANLIRAGERLFDLARKRGLRLSGIGIGSPGTVKYPEGIVTASSPNIPGWVGVNISRIFKDFPVPIRGDNDANCMGLAELLFGAGRGTRSGFYLTIGTGIGGAIVIDGSLVRGASFAAGEFGHTVFKYNGIKGKSGRRGCLETYVAAPALVQSTKSKVRRQERSLLKKNLESISPREIFKAFKERDKAATEAVLENAEMLGVAIGSVVNLINPEIVVIGGGMSHGSAAYIDLIRKHVNLFAFDSATSKLRIRVARFGNDAGWIGAACLNMTKSEI